MTALRRRLIESVRDPTLIYWLESITRAVFKHSRHVMFAIDRRARDRVYYINSRAFQFHKDFVNATYLSLERGRIFYDNNFLKSDRRFILGTIAYHTGVDKFAFEFWEGDQITRICSLSATARSSRVFIRSSFSNLLQLHTKRLPID